MLPIVKMLKKRIEQIPLVYGTQQTISGIKKINHQYQIAQTKQAQNKVLVGAGVAVAGVIGRSAYRTILDITKPHKEYADYEEAKYKKLLSERNEIDDYFDCHPEEEYSFEDIHGD